MVMVDECGYVRVWDIVAGKFRVEMVDVRCSCDRSVQTTRRLFTR